MNVTIGSISHGDKYTAHMGKWDSVRFSDGDRSIQVIAVEQDNGRLALQLCAVSPNCGRLIITPQVSNVINVEVE